MDKKEARRSIMLLLMEIDYILRYGNLCDDSAKKLNDNTLHDFTSDFDSNKDELESPKDKYICNVNSNVESFFSKKENNEKSTLELDGLKFSSGKEVHELSTTHDKSDAGTHDNQSECLTSYQHLSKQFCPAMEILNSATLENPLNDKLVDTKKALSASIDKTFEHLINPNDPVKCTSKDLGVDQANLLMKLESSINVSAKEFGHCDAKDIQSCSAMKSASSETTEKISSITQEHRADKSNTSSQTSASILDVSEVGKTQETSAGPPDNTTLMNASNDSITGMKSNPISLRLIRRTAIVSDSEKPKTQGSCQSCICDVCDLKVNSKETLLKHFRDVHGISKMVCRLCNCNFSSEQYIDHDCTTSPKKKKQGDENNVPIKCKSCDNTFQDRRELVRHVKAQHRQARNPCSECKLCGMKFAMYSMLLNHRKFHHSKNLCCNKCGSSFTSKEEYLAHCQTHAETSQEQSKKAEPNQTKSVQNHVTEAKSRVKHCSFCRMPFTNVKYLRKHEAKFHDVKIPRAKRHACGICSKLFSRPHVLKIHKRIHSGNKPFQCKVCEKSFYRKESLQDHKCGTSGSNDSKTIANKSMLCDLCGASFRTTNHLSRHKRSKHSDEKPFECPHCDYRSKLESNINRHILVHTSSHKFICKQCGQSFNYQANLKEHELFKHSDDKSFSCKECDKLFKTKNGLRKHMEIHNDIKPYECKCKKTFRRLFHLKRHIARVHYLDDDNGGNVKPSTSKKLPGEAKQLQTFGASTNNVSKSSGNTSVLVSVNDKHKTVIDMPLLSNGAQETIPRVFEQKYTELSQSAASPLTNLTPVNNPGSSLSILASLQNYDKNDQLFANICYDKQSVDFMPDEITYEQPSDGYMQPAYSQTDGMDIVDCITIDSTHRDLDNISHHQSVPYQHSNADETNFTVLMNTDSNRHNSSAFLDHFLPSLTVPSQDSYTQNEYPNEPQQCTIAGLSSLPLSHNSMQFDDNAQMAQPDCHSAAAANEFIPNYSDDTICNLQSAHQVISYAQNIVYAQNNPVDDFQQCYDDIQPSLLGPNTAQPINGTSSVIQDIHQNYLIPAPYNISNGC